MLDSEDSGVSVGGPGRSVLEVVGGRQVAGGAMG